MTQLKSACQLPKEEDDDHKFSNAKAKLGEKDLLGHAVHLDIDKDKDIFIRSATLDQILNHVPTSELIQVDKTWAPQVNNANFFGEVPEEDEPNPNQ